MDGTSSSDKPQPSFSYFSEGCKKLISLSSDDGKLASGTFVGWPPKPLLYIKQCFAYEIYLSFCILPILPPQKNPYVGQYARTTVQIPLCCCFLLAALQVSYSPGWHPTSFLDHSGFPSAEIAGLHHHTQLANCSNPTLIH